MGGRSVALVLGLLLACGGVFATLPSDYSPDMHVADLAAKMLNLTQGNDFTMDCGPGSEVINTFPSTGSASIQGKSYCIMNLSTPANRQGQMLIGTFLLAEGGDAGVPKDVLTLVNDVFYNAQIQPGDVNLQACDGKGINGFELCVSGTTPAIKNMYTYIYDTTVTTGASYIIISDQPLGTLKGSSIVERILDFFRGILSFAGL
jgi:hypothetical protein